MRITSSRILILAALVSLVAVVLPGAWEYLTVRACVQTGVLTTSGTYCPQGDERLPVLAVHWIRVPTVASTAMGVIVAIVIGLLFILRHRRRQSPLPV